MRGYHIRIVLNRKAFLSNSNTEFIPSSLFQELPLHSSTTRRETILKWARKDYRYGSIRIDWLDQEIMSVSTGKEKRGTSTCAHLAYSVGPASATFIPNKTGSTNLPEGIVHVYRESGREPTEQTVVDSGEVMLGVLAVPSWMTPSDFLAFVAPAEGIAHLRMIRDASPNRSMVVVKFFNQDYAAEFIEGFNGKPFNSTEVSLLSIVVSLCSQKFAM